MNAMNGYSGIQKPKCSCTPAMGSPAACTHILSASCSFPSLGYVSSGSTQIFSKFPLVLSRNADPFSRSTNLHNHRVPTPKIRAALDGTNQETSTPVLVNEEEEENKQPSEVCFTDLSSYYHQLPCCWILYSFFRYIKMNFKQYYMYLWSGQQTRSVIRPFSIAILSF